MILYYGNLTYVPTRTYCNLCCLQALFLLLLLLFLFLLSTLVLLFFLFLRGLIPAAIFLASLLARFGFLNRHVVRGLLWSFRSRSGWSFITTTQLWWLGLAVILVRFQKVLGCLLVGLAVLVQLAVLDERLLALCHGSKSPSSWVDISLHNHTLDLCDNAMVHSCHDRSRHLSNGDCNCFSLCGHQDNLIVKFNTVRKSQ
mmetsp:Transcript_11220/g.26968  ORF Transcript_11220/g.26968 Transcript_11220/m.26968 type:complete len:200 (-) Transcript_11220:986-1585(-)